MKTFGALFVSALVCFGQSSPEPDMADIFYRLDKDKLIPLERQSAAFHASAHGFMVMSIKSTTRFPGAKSPIRFKSGQLDLVVRSVVPTSAIDPNTIYCLRKLNPKKKTRELVMMSGHVSPIGASTTGTPAEGILPVQFSIYGASLKMTTGELAPGEYAVGPTDRRCSVSVWTSRSFFLEAGKSKKSRPQRLGCRFRHLAHLSRLASKIKPI
jgi:hypothetical protein